MSSGKYCGNPNPELNITNGTLIIFEDLRQKCIYNYGRENNISSLYLDYMFSFYVYCLTTTPRNFSGNCSNEIMLKINVEPSKIQTCIENSFVGKL